MVGRAPAHGTALRVEPGGRSFHSGSGKARAARQTRAHSTFSGWSGRPSPWNAGPAAHTRVRLMVKGGGMSDAGAGPSAGYPALLRPRLRSRMRPRHFDPLGLGAGFGLLGAATMDHLPFFAVNDSSDLRSRFASSCI